MHTKKYRICAWKIYDNANNINNTVCLVPIKPYKWESGKPKIKANCKSRSTRKVTLHFLFWAQGLRVPTPARPSKAFKAELSSLLQARLLIFAPHTGSGKSLIRNTIISCVTLLVSVNIYSHCFLQSFYERKCFNVHTVCTNFSLNIDTICTNFGLNIHTPVYKIKIRKCMCTLKRASEKAPGWSSMT